MARLGRGGRLVAVALALGLPGGSSRAQDAPTLHPASYLEWGFVDRSPRPGRAFTDVAVHPADPALVLAVTRGGSAWLSADGGATWFPVLEVDPTRLGSMSTDEQVRQQVEAEIEDVLSDEGLDDLEALMVDEGLSEEEAAELLAERAEEAAEDVASQVQSDLDTNPGFLVDPAEAPEGGTDAWRPRAFVTADDRLFVARGDGLIASTDLGSTWDLVLEGPVNTLLALPGGGLVAGTPEGFHTSVDGARWEAVSDRTDAIEVLDVAIVDGRMWAATSEGLVASVDGRGWQAVGLVEGKARALAVDPSAPSTVWVAFERTVYTTRDGGVTFEPTLLEPVPDVRDLLALGSGHVLAIDPDGPLESIDGGATWTRRDEGLHGADAWTFADVGGRLWLASDEGLARLEPPEVLALRAAALGSPPEFVAFGDLLGASLRRAGVGGGAGRGARFAASALPRLQVEGRYVSGDDLSYLDSRGTTRGDDGVFTVVGRLQWVPGRRSTSGGVEILVSEGEVLVDGGGDQRMLAARMDRQAAEYQRKLAQSITELYYRRAVLVAERGLKRSDPLVVRVAHEIAIQEVEARLDVFTDGIVSAWRAGRADQE